MSRSDIDRLRDARDFAQHARANAGGLAARALAGATLPQHAVLYNVVIIGEALGKVSAEVKAAAPELPWKAVANLRNIIVHSYWQIDLGIIANIVQSKIEPLEQELEKLIEFVARSEP